MPIYRLPYGQTHLPLTLPGDLDVTVLAPRDADPLPDLPAVAAAALRDRHGPLDTGLLSRARTAAVALSDKTRPASQEVLRATLAWLGDEVGLRPEAITLLIANGAHPPMTPGEFPLVLPPDLLARHAVISHDCDDDAALAYLGETPRGTPVWISRAFLAADLRVVVGNIEAHQFMGFSGGVKGAAIGLAGRATISANHALLGDPRALAGRYDDNPARQDVEDIGRLAGVHLAVNAVLNRDQRVVHVLAGEPLAVMRAGIPLVRALVEVPVPAPFDLAIAAPGGHPKDLNLYQAQKALAHAALVVRAGGAVILVAACGEGAGSAAYEAWMAGMTSHQAVLDRFAGEGFRLGPHKAFLIARDAIRLREVLLVSAMPPETVRRALLTPAASLDEAVARALPALGPGARAAIMPAANATVPVLAG
jgi:nickel-dependent lactate racemase